MTAAVLPAPATPQIDAEVAHLWDCRPDLSWCGKDITDDPDADDRTPDCPLCLLADETDAHACHGSAR